MTDGSLPSIGTIVTVDDPRCIGLYKVLSRGPKNAGLSPCNADGSLRPGRGARMPGWMLHPVNLSEAVTLAEKVPMPPPPAAIFDPGVVVTSKTAPGVFVVIADKVDKVNVAKLGGDNGRYWRLPPAALTVVPLAELARHL
jgi:hypothetical protein